jgi:hypothetical protein|tara:strand:+ start:87 stop:875 length:789 start_codon:yes stop_codon:yes gene_type:complete
MKNLFDPKEIVKKIKIGFEYFQNYFIGLLLEFLINSEGFLVVIYTLATTLGVKTAILLSGCWCLDQIDIFLRKLTGEPPRDIYSLTWVDRGFAFLAAVWSMGELFAFFPAVVLEYNFLQEIYYHVLRGIGYFINLNEFNSTAFSFFIFREVVRRRGPDTQWFGDTKKYWIKNVVRYHWCFSFCLNTVLQIYMYTMYKFLLPGGMPLLQQEIVQTTFFFMLAAIICYAGICALLGLRCRVPLFHGACILHVGRLKNDKGGSEI